MPFPMVHLSSAKNILNHTREIVKPCEFLLGSIAPDSVHFRANYVSEMKKISHLCIGNEKWGQVTNNSEWTDSVLEFFMLHRQSENIDFVLGYCAHILADIRNNIEIWTPFRMKHQEELDNGLGSALHKDAAAIDFELYRTHVEREAIWELLEQSQEVDIGGLVNGLDIERMKSNLLYSQFTNREPSDVSANKCIVMKDMMDFITNESEYIKAQLLSCRC